MSESRSESDNNNNNRSNISSTANSNTIESKPKSESLALESESKKRKSFASSPSSSMSNSLEQKQKIPNVVSTNDQQKQLSETITKLFTQLTKGCGRINCRNERCCSNLLIDPLPVNEAAAKAVLLAPSAIERYYLCSDSNVVSMSTPDELLQLATEAARDNNVVPLIRKIGVVFGNWHSLVLSFHPRLDDDLDVKKLSEFYSIVNALERPKHVLKSSLERLLADFKYALPPINSPILDKALEIIEKHPQAFESTDEGLLASFGAALLHLQPKPKQALIARWSSYDSDHLKQWLGKMNGALDLLIMREMELPEPKSINELAGVQAIVGVLAILNVINKNRIDDVERLESVVDLEADRLLMEHIENRKSTTSTTLSTTTTVAATPHAAPSVALSKKPFATFQEFQNGLIEEMLDLSLDFTNNIRGVGFSLTAHPFLLETGLKAKVLRLKSMVAQRQEGINAVRALHSGLSNAQPVLAIKVRRANIVEDTFRELQRVSAKDLRKELRVTFEQEEAVDEGGVRKEWFQLLVREIFDPKYGMFVYNETTRHYWFRRDSPERLFYNLMGSLLGMAIYNGVVLDVHFPSIVYKLLLGERALLSDLAEIDAELHRGLQQLLNFDGDVEDVYDRTFEVEYEEFGVAKKAELIKGGSELALTNDNRHDYVRLYAKHMLLDSVREQWAAFRRGFELVCERSTMDGFVWQELELLIAGSPVLDFHALERAARYSDRYDADHATIRRFWTVVHSLDVDQQRQLLHFTTGSDRAPIGGLGKLKLGIVYQPDSDRLPTSHTCFNQLILPDYPTEEKMREKLLAAIANAEGFGMI